MHSFSISGQYKRVITSDIIYQCFTKISCQTPLLRWLFFISKLQFIYYRIKIYRKLKIHKFLSQKLFAEIIFGKITSKYLLLQKYLIYAWGLIFTIFVELMNIAKMKPPHNFQIFQYFFLRKGRWFRVSTSV